MLTHVFTYSYMHTHTHVAESCCGEAPGGRCGNGGGGGEACSLLCVYLYVPFGLFPFTVNGVTLTQTTSKAFLCFTVYRRWRNRSHSSSVLTCDTQLDSFQRPGPLNCWHPHHRSLTFKVLPPGKRLFLDNKLEREVLRFCQDIRRGGTQEADPQLRKVRRKCNHLITGPRKSHCSWEIIWLVFQPTKSWGERAAGFLFCFNLVYLFIFYFSF